MLLQVASPEVPHALMMGKPAIAAINGPAVGVGLTMTLACDIRIASTAARFSARFVKVGLSPECGSTRYLPLVAGFSNALFLALTGRIIDADEALKRGTGARGLRAILEEVLLDVMYDLPSRTDVVRCVVDRSVVLEKMHPTLVTVESDRRTA